MATRKLKKQRKASVQNSQKAKAQKRPGWIPANAFRAGNPWRYKKGESGNPGGRPRLLSGAYKEWLACEDAHGVTNAAKLAVRTGDIALTGSIQATHEIRTATEGTRLVTWRDEIVAALVAGDLSADELKAELGEDATELLVAAGLAGDEGAQAPAPDSNASPSGTGASGTSDPDPSRGGEAG